jgi:hypothetical protein
MPEGSAGEVSWVGAAVATVLSGLAAFGLKAIGHGRDLRDAKTRLDSHSGKIRNLELASERHETHNGYILVKLDSLEGKIETVDGKLDTIANRLPKK